MKAFFSIFAVVYVLGGLAAVVAWVTNALYVFQHFSSAITMELIVAVIGVLMAPLGVLHGVYLWF